MVKLFTIFFKPPFRPSWLKGLLASALCLMLSVQGAQDTRAQNATGGGLHEALRTAALYNPDLQAARLRVLAEAEDIEQAYGRVLPQLEIALSTAHTDSTAEYKDDANDRYRSDTYSNSSAALVWRQAIYAGGALWAAVDIAKASLGASLQDLRAEEQNILQAAADAFINYRRRKIIETLRVSNIARLQKHLLASEQAFTLGEVNRTDVAQAESRLAVAEAEHREAEGDVAVASAEYRRVIGADLPLSPELPVIGEDVTYIIGERTSAETNEMFDVLAQMAEDDNPIARAARLRLSEAEHRVRFERSDHFPDISASASLSHNDSNENLRADNRQSLTVRGDIIIPLYSGGVTSSKVRQARFNYNRRKQESTANLRQVRQNLVSALARYNAMQAQQEARKKAVSSAELALRGTETEYRLGTRNVLDLLDSERDLVEAQIAGINSESDLYIAYYSLQAAVGRLTADALELPNPMAAVGAAIESDKNIRRAVRQTDKSGDLNDNGDNSEGN